MKNKPILLISLCLLLPIVIYWSIYPQIKPITVLCLGDSITMGVGGTHGGYRGYLKLMLGERYQLITEAHKGWTSEQLLKFVPHTMLEVKPDIVLLSIGSNDTAQNKNAEEILSNTLKIIAVLEQNMPIGTQIRVGGVVCNSIKCYVLNDLLSSVFEYKYVDFGYFDYHRADEYHPNDMGYSKMAKAWYQAIRR